MAGYLHEIRRRELSQPPNSLRMARYLMDMGIFEENLDDDWPRSRNYLATWQLELTQEEPTEPQPACQEAIKKLETSVIQSEGKDCSICLMDFKKNEVAKSMPCHHMFHEVCLLTWLNQNNTCPFCRHRLPTGGN